MEREVARMVAPTNHPSSVDVAVTDDRHAKLMQIVDELDLDNPLDQINKLGSEDFGTALHEEDARGIILWAKLRPFLFLYARAFPQTVVLSERELAASIDVALEESEFFLTQHLIKTYLKGAGPLTCGQLAERRYLRGTASWEKYKQTLAREIFDHMRDLQLWEITTLGRDDNGGGAIAGYKISAGPALIDFHTYVFQRIRQKQHQRFFLRFKQLFWEQ
jgi:hypothetical protein